MAAKIVRVPFPEVPVASSRRVLAVLAVTAFAAGVPARAAERPRLVVLVSVDQMRADYLERGRDLWSGGLRRLLDEGAWFGDAAFSYSHTVTCAGHATLSTGTLPARHGMVLNEWWDRATADGVRCTEDASLRDWPIGGEPRAEGPGDGPGRLLSATLADVLRFSRDARVAVFSIKARSAITLAGQRADAIAWLADDGRWTTSSHYGPAPGFLVELAKTVGPAADAGRAWERRLALDRYFGVDASPWERPPDGWDVELPHGIAAQGEPGLVGQWKTSPFADAAVARLALGAVRELELGSDPRRVDLLAVGFSALDAVGHAFGPESHEVQDLLFHLDATLGELIDGLDANVGAGNWVLGLSADHGVAPIPERVSDAGLEAGRISPSAIAREVEAALAAVLGPGRRVAGATHTDLYFEPGGWEALRDSPAARAAALTAILAVPGVERVYTREQLISGPDELDATGRRVARSFHPERSGDLLLVWKPYWISSSAATTHGTSRGYDRNVPLLLLGSEVVPGRYLAPASPVDLAPTLATLAGVTLGETDGRLLAEALRP
jgi:predicted AlkP superfamily pyrophosphatase or phosphodiesterase